MLLLGLGALVSQAQTLATRQTLPPLLAQDERVESLKTTLEKIAKAYQVDFAYDEHTVEKIKVRRKSWTNKGLEETLNQVLEPLDLSFKKLAKDYYVIHRRTAPRVNVLKGQSLLSVEQLPALGSVHNLQHQAAIISIALEKTISGQVTDQSEGTTLPGVNIVAKGTTVGSVTDIDGNYKITVPDETEVLVFSSVGYLSEEITIGNQTVVNVAMEPDIQSLQEVVVVGYGTQERRDVTGSVSQVKGEAFELQPITSVDQALQGRAAGVFVGSSGGPGATLDIRIRGANSINAGVAPLYVVDGVPLSMGNLGDEGGTLQVGGTQNIMSTINPNDIASIEILKDASATAIYGSRGSNGVILITTKSGKIGKPKLSIDYYYGINQAANRLDLMQGPEFAQVVEGVEKFRNQPGSFATYAYGEGISTDWQEAVLRTGPIQNANVGLSGGGEAVKYNISVNYFDNQGVFINSYLNRFSARLNLDFELSDRLSLGMRIAGSKQNSAFPSASFSGANMRFVVQAPPTFPTLDENGFYTDPALLSGQNIFNPYAVLDGVEVDNPNYRLLSNVFGTYRFTDWLEYKLTVGGDILQDYRKVYQPTDVLYGIDSKGFGQIRNRDQNNWVITNQLSFKKDFNKKHRLNAVAVYEVSQNSTQWATLGGRDFFTNNFGLDNLGITIDPEVGSGAYESSIISYLGRINYTWLDRYLFTLSTRVDGASRFGANNKWGVFPSGAFAWRASEEDFLRNLGWLSDLKFRASYGVTGNQAIPNFQSLATLELRQYGTPQFYNGLVLNRMGNSALGWERSAQFDIGVDLGVFNNRLTFAADYYRKRTSNMLLELAVPRTTGFGELWSNEGGMEIEGFELSVISRNLTGNFEWTTNANFSTVYGQVTDLANQPPIIINGNWNVAGGTPRTSIVAIITEGQQLNNFIGYVADGMIQQGDVDKIENRHLDRDNRRAGDVNYVDLNNDGVLNNDDIGVIGNANANLFFGLTNTFSYRNFTLDVFIQGTQGNDLMNTLRGRVRYGLDPGSNMLSGIYANRWRGNNPTNEYTGFNFDRELSSLYVEDASYVRLQTVTFSYDVPGGLIRGVSGMRVYVSGNNLFTLTRYSGYDPGYSNSDNLVRGFDSGWYPLEQTFIGGIKLNF